uniref:Pentatricopeptide repeat-containing protein At1g08070, chloroplastic-like n=1 Tax=Nelumbo nucifera TaxID=4432 RepID=A0A822ZF98_NELNU|nr:TPA_asm: hypothetical protein HUJ06_003094 [Nelumbo nucifera]
MLSVAPAIPKLKNRFSSHLFLLSFSRFLSRSSTSPRFGNFSLLLQGHPSLPRLLQIHARIYRFGADQDDLIATRLIGRYPIQVALKVFRLLREPNIFPFNAIIRRLAEDGLFDHAFSLFKSLKVRSISPNDFTFSFLLKACFKSADARHVQQIHTHIVTLGFDHDSVGVVSSWTCLIAGYAQLGRSEEALVLFLRMIEQDIRPENDTMVSILSACSSLDAQEVQRWEKNFLELASNFDGNTNECYHDSINTILVYLYGKWGKVEKSRELFDKLTERGRRSSVLPWNAMITGYVQNGFPVEALSVFQLMVAGGNPKPNHVTMVSVLSACAQVGDLDLGSGVHEYMKTNGSKDIVESNTFLATALIDMYSKCGSLGKAKEVFDQMVAKDVVAFNAIIMGLAINGKGEEALRLFSMMEELGVHPNGGTFLSVLCACNHSGLAGEGRQIFLDMIPRYSITPNVEHYASYIDLLARVGHIEEALKVVSLMPIEPNGMVWGALLAGCLLHSRVDLAPDVARSLVKVDPCNSAGYVMLSNVYAIEHQWDTISELRGMMSKKGIKKQPGCSWISVNGVLHEFLVGSRSHPQIERIYHILDGLSKEIKSLGP